MLFNRKKSQTEKFEKLCKEYYEKILHYLFFSLGNETMAKDCTQEVFLLAFQKIDKLSHHPNPGGFLFQTAKILCKKAKRESFLRLLKEESADEIAKGIPDINSDITFALDKEINEDEYIDNVLSHLSDEKLKLYNLYYISKKTMGEIAEILGLEETAVRMRFVRLRREIKGIVSEVAKQEFNF